MGIFDAALDDAFYAAKRHKAELEERALATAARWVWMDGLCVPLDPEPYRWQRHGFELAVVTDAPASPGRSGHSACGLDGDDRLVVQRHFADDEPTLGLWSYLDRRIRYFGYPAPMWTFTPPACVRDIFLGEGNRVTRMRSYGNQAMWPEDRDLEAADVARLKKSERYLVSELDEAYTWDGERLVRVGESHFEYTRHGALKRIWREHFRKPKGETRWSARKKPRSTR